jgi:hypothetical protein
MEMEEALKLCKEKCLDMKNVVGVGQGKKEGNDIIYIMVSEKTEEINKIPKRVGNIEIEIKEVGNIKAE